MGIVEVGSHNELMEALPEIGKNGGIEGAYVRFTDEKTVAQAHQAAQAVLRAPAFGLNGRLIPTEMMRTVHDILDTQISYPIPEGIKGSIHTFVGNGSRTPIHQDIDTFPHTPVLPWMQLSGASEWRTRRLQSLDGIEARDIFDTLIDYDEKGVEFILPERFAEFARTEIVGPAVMAFAAGIDTEAEIYASAHEVLTSGDETRLSASIPHDVFFPKAILGSSYPRVMPEWLQSVK